MVIPDSVRAFIWMVFRTCNLRVASRLATQPNTHESTLDEQLVAEVQKFAGPVRVDDWMSRTLAV